MTLGSVLFLIFAVASTLDVVSMGLTAAFLDKQWSVSAVLLRFAVSTAIVMLLAAGGLALGYLGTAWLDGTTATWFAASLMFLLAVKLVYDGLKTSQMRRSINPTAISGLAALSVLTGINTFIYSIGFGLLNVSCSKVWYFAPLFFAALLITSIAGRKQTRLHHIYNGWIQAALALFSSILIIYNNQI